MARTPSAHARARATHRAGPAAAASIGTRAAWAALLVLVLSFAPWLPARAGGLQLTGLEVSRNEEGLTLSFTTRFSLPSPVEDALLRGVPLHFVADATAYRSRWYWRDKPVAHASRTWRLAWQPLTRSYRVTFGVLNQTYESLEDALAAVRGTARWRIADPAEVEDGVDYVEFSYRLDTGQLPRPMQIGLAGQADWALAIERSVALP